MRNLSLILFLFLASCSCEYHIRKVHKKCGVETDSITVIDTVRIPEVHTDSVFFYNQKDTVLITKGNLEIKYYYSHDSVYIDGKCKEVVVVKERVVRVDKYKSTESYWYLWVIGFLLVIILMKRFKLL